MQTAKDFIEFATLNQKTRKYLKEMNQLFPGGWGVEELADLICQRSTGKHLKELEAPSPEGQSEPKASLPKVEPTPQAKPAIQGVIPAGPMGQDIEARYALYLQHFQPETPNDELNLYTLCQHEVTLQRLNDRRLRQLESNARAGDIRAIVDSITKVSEDSARLQKLLGIDRPSRGTGQDAGDKLMDYIKRAKEVLHRQSVPLYCTACYRSDSQVLNLYGYTVWHLQDEDVDWQLTYECPRCHQTMTYNRETVADLKGLIGW